MCRSMSSLVMGGVWLIALTNEQGGRQLGRFILYYSLAFAESAICGFLWNLGMAGSGDFFAAKVRERPFQNMNAIKHNTNFWQHGPTQPG